MFTINAFVLLLVKKFLHLIKVIYIFGKNAIMFYFGLFSTHLPYLIIGIFYFIYLITFAFVKLNPGFDASKPNTCDVKSISINNIKADKPVSQRNAFYADFIFIEYKEEAVPVIHSAITPNFILRDFKPIAQFFCFKLFPNPPPLSFS